MDKLRQACSERFLYPENKKILQKGDPGGVKKITS